MREFLFKLLLLLGSVLFTLVIGELALRLTTPREIMRYFFVAPDPVLHHRFTAGASGRYQSTEFDTRYEINRYGLRDRDFPLQKPAGVKRILMLGDSFTEGDGVEIQETFAKVLEQRLRASWHSQTEVINAGVGSYSPLLEYLYLKREGITFEPDLVILNLDLSDFFDDIGYSRLAESDSTGLPLRVPAEATDPGSRSAATVVKDFFKENTRLYNWVRLRINRYLEGARHEGNFGGDLRYDKYAMLRENHDTTDDREWKLTYRYLGLIRDLLEDRGIEFWITVYPYGVQVSPAEWNTGRVFWGFKQDTLYSVKPQSYVETFGRRNGIRVVNLCQGMRDSSGTAFPLYLPDNGHFTPRGHQVIAALLEREFVTRR